jgi:ATP-dependent DNA ligase
VLHHVGVASSFTMARRKQLAEELEPLRKNAMKDKPPRDCRYEQLEVTTPYELAKVFAISSRKRPSPLP